jgi:hypothetical protein
MFWTFYKSGRRCAEAMKAFSNLTRDEWDMYCGGLAESKCEILLLKGDAIGRCISFSLTGETTFLKLVS